MRTLCGLIVVVVVLSSWTGIARAEDQPAAPVEKAAKVEQESVSTEVEIETQPEAAKEKEVSQASEPAAETEAPSTAPFIGNKNSKKLHRASCRWGMKTSPAKRVYFKTYEEAVKAGYIPCKACKPDLAAAKTEASTTAPFIGNNGSKKVHSADCRWGMKTSPAKRVYFKTYEEAVKAGYIPCKACKPDLAAKGAGMKKHPAAAAAEGEFCASVKGKAFHRASCMWASKISPRNLVKYKTRKEATAAGKKPCSTCKP